MPKKLTGIAAADEDFLIGFNAEESYRLPWGRQMQGDLEFFRKITAGQPVIMGRKTFQSIGRLLPGRPNIILSRKAMALPGGILLPDWTPLDRLLRPYSQAFLIGGADLFAQALERGLLSGFYLTRIKARLAPSARPGEMPIYLPQGGLLPQGQLIQRLEPGPENLYSAEITYLQSFG